MKQLETGSNLAVTSGPADDVNHVMATRRTGCYPLFLGPNWPLAHLPHPTVGVQSEITIPNRQWSDASLLLQI